MLGGNRMTAVDCGLLVRLVISLVSYAAVIDETLRAGKVLPVTINANQFNSYTISSSYKSARPGFVTLGWVAAGKRLQLLTGCTADRPPGMGVE